MERLSALYFEPALTDHEQQPAALASILQCDTSPYQRSYQIETRPKQTRELPFLFRQQI